VNNWFCDPFLGSRKSQGNFLNKRLIRLVASYLAVIYLLGGTICDGKLVLCIENDGHTALEVRGGECCQLESQHSCTGEHESSPERTTSLIKTDCECCLDISAFIDTPVFRSNSSSKVSLNNLITCAFGLHQPVIATQSSPSQDQRSIALLGSSAILVSLQTVILLI